MTLIVIAMLVIMFAIIKASVERVPAVCGATKALGVVDGYIEK